MWPRTGGQQWHDHIHVDGHTQRKHIGHDDGQLRHGQWHGSGWLGLHRHERYTVICSRCDFEDHQRECGGDRTAEPNETFFVNLSNIVGGVLGDAQGLEHDSERRRRGIDGGVR